MALLPGDFSCSLTLFQVLCVGFVGRSRGSFYVDQVKCVFLTPDSSDPTSVQVSSGSSLPTAGLSALV